MKCLRVLQPSALIACSILLTQVGLRAQSEQSAAQSPAMRLEVRFADQNAASTKSAYRVHVRPVMVANLNRYSPFAGSAAGSQMQTSSKVQSTATEAPLAVPTTVPAVPSPGFYPADLSHLGGPVITGAENHPLFVDCPQSCWGSPINFLNHLVKSTFMHIVDQYVGATANNRYTVGTSGTVSYPILNTLSDNDILQIVHTAASSLGSGYDHIYHIFLPKGVDLCFRRHHGLLFPGQSVHLRLLRLPRQRHIHRYRPCAFHRRTLPECYRLFHRTAEPQRRTHRLHQQCAEP
jgi:hypothetical protein